MDFFEKLIFLKTVEVLVIILTWCLAQWDYVYK